MQPLGRKPIRFPGKRDCHPLKPYVNWWEIESATESKKADRQKAKQEIKNEVNEYYQERDK